MFRLVLPGFVIGRRSSPRSRREINPRTPSLGVNVLSAVLVGRASRDHHWPVLGDPEDWELSVFARVDCEHLTASILARRKLKELSEEGVKAALQKLEPIEQADRNQLVNYFSEHFTADAAVRAVLRVNDKGALMNLYQWYRHCPVGEAAKKRHLEIQFEFLDVTGSKLQPQGELQLTISL